MIYAILCHTCTLSSVAINLYLCCLFSNMRGLFSMLPYVRLAQSHDFVLCCVFAEFVQNVWCFRIYLVAVVCAGICYLAVHMYHLLKNASFLISLVFTTQPSILKMFDKIRVKWMYILYSAAICNWERTSSGLEEATGARSVTD